MFDITSSKLFLLAIVALLVIGPKEFPVLLRTIGKYVGIIRGHAREFRAQFDEAMRESELAQMKKDMEDLGREAQSSFTAATQSAEQTFADARQSVESSVTSAEASVTNPLAPVDPIPQEQAAEGPAVPSEQPAGEAAQSATVAVPASSHPAPAPVVERTTGA